MDVILEGIVGSHAYGLAHEGSDIDYRGIYIAPTIDVLSLGKTKETIESKDPDRVLHELEKFIRLALAANPNIIELLYLDEYIERHTFGVDLVEYRRVFVSQRAVNSYGGYAVSQLAKMKRLQRVDRKHARHCLRLLRQGRQYITEGHLNLKVDPEEYFAMDEMALEDVIQLLEDELEVFNSTVPLVDPDPDVEFANDLLLDARVAYMP